MEDIHRKEKNDQEVNETSKNEKSDKPDTSKKTAPKQEKKDGKLVNSGGRVLGVTAVEKDLKSAIASAYALTETVHFDNAYYRKDIGKRALAALTEEV